ncbi:D-amino-acid dehydrogenase [Pseudochrobactrum saccharolyticum]|uniref:D-amino-acid dehydrogenase n=1 Tax=Pseudochrobactrum saccharolyticum TaxID=354352 RepID=A0A7W8AJ80_9HYPH|nr:FAD-dependent oxidoreductase [Pseudochrobactrum saccharolyticum]KAB0538136.1 FAD-binding oxidoreductase [Pseudochrobactrum saccharolyticum]MBB5091368.1 D-amino-acid dehydrogenase [Pseudochrobactrum saccharolyticum]
MRKFDTIILGAGIIGVSTALHLQARGHSVCLIDKKDPGEGTSYGNAGLIERSSVIPYSFPRGLANLIKYGLNNRTDVRYDLAYMPKLAPWLFQFWRHSSADGLAKATKAMLPLVEASVTEHDFLIGQAGCQNLVQDKGWLEAFCSEQAFDAFVKTLPSLDRFGLNYKVLNSTGFAAAEPSMRNIAGAVHWLDPKTVNDPSALVKAYASLFTQRGGVFLHGDASTLQQNSDGWSVRASEPVTARNVVAALGPQSHLIYDKAGMKLPMAVKRGTHLHFSLDDGAVLNHPVVEVEGGYVLAPMRQGMRLTTGIEFAAPDAPANRILLDRAEKRARKVLPSLGKPVEAQPWLGLRPCMPDMRPVIGQVPNKPGLWMNFGHAHHGLTLGPASGRLLAELMTGEKPFIPAEPYSASRFM